MLNALIQASTANPGTFDPVYSTPVAAYLAGAVILAGGLIALWGSITNNAKVGVPILVAGALLFAGGFAGFGYTAVSFQGDKAEARTTYNTAVATWLDAAYGIEASPEHTAGLVAGTPFAAEYDGKTVTASIITTATGDLALINEAKEPLAPLNRR